MGGGGSRPLGCHSWAKGAQVSRRAPLSLARPPTPHAPCLRPGHPARPAGRVGAGRLYADRAHAGQPGQRGLGRRLHRMCAACLFPFLHGRRVPCWLFCYHILREDVVLLTRLHLTPLPSADCPQARARASPPSPWRCPSSPWAPPPAPTCSPSRCAPARAARLLSVHAARRRRSNLPVPSCHP